MPNIPRLKQLLAHVKALPKDRIDMNIWSNDININDCGTAACLGGHATTLFPEEIQIQDSWSSRQYPYYIKHLINGDIDGDALQAVFDLDDDDIFTADRDAWQAIENLEQFIENNS